ncbi:hypothetical protein XU18_3610 [Perkinsela sp. CCAP 1560/4]|nr:hypothetical protein XU18_3610 [Perkinsela sp. CCAP 1560/4]|eukprot:KNH05370.1 hypothetical protein XU18_3610 [Perkinsela sp. CCAP 1560/4]
MTTECLLKKKRKEKSSVPSPTRRLPCDLECFVRTLDLMCLSWKLMLLNLRHNDLSGPITLLRLPETLDSINLRNHRTMSVVGMKTCLPVEMSRILVSSRENCVPSMCHVMRVQSLHKLSCNCVHSWTHIHFVA